VQALLAGGLRVTRLGLTWQDRVAFVVNDKLELKRLELLGIESDSDADDGGDAEVDAAAKFDVDFMLMAGELSKLLAELDAAMSPAGAVRQAAA